MTNPINKTVLPGLALALLTSTSAVAQDRSDAQSNVEVRRVTLATGGLAQVEGGVTGATDTMRLAIERAQVADVLRTLVVTGNTTVVSVDLKSAEAVGARSVTGQLLAGDLSDPRTLLASLIGEEVELSGGPNNASGRLLDFTLVTIPGGEDEGDRPAVRVALASENGGVSFTTFPSLDALSIGGAAVEERMNALVPAIGESVDDGRRELEINLSEAGEPGFDFVVPTTVWRPSYRALVADDGSVELQGWATLENTTGLDWNGIELRLAVGTPVAYSQDIYSPLRTTRPTAPFEVGDTATVDIVPGQVGRAELAEADLVQAEAAFASRVLGDGAAAPAPQAAAPTADLQTGGPAEIGAASTVFPVSGTIDLAAGRTLSVPFLSRSEDVARITYLDLTAAASPSDPTPLDALELTFDAEASVPGGLVAVYDEGSFVGDARFEGADGGELRILPFAASTDMDVNRTERLNTVFVSAGFEGSTFTVRSETRRRVEFAVAADEEGTLVLDLPRGSGEELSVEGSESQAVQTARIDESRERLRADLSEGQHTLSATFTRPVQQTIGVTDLSGAYIAEVLALGDEIDDETRQRLEDIGAQLARIDALERDLETLEAERRELLDLIALDRRNLDAIGVQTPEGADIRQRIIERTDRIDALRSETRSLREQRERLRSALTDA